ncbi:uncharacterized protein LOC109840438 [Asparagus officinalis]|uniref:uncharacterized protein LOC109840438 n=1 Tax=Asparagus officinalis TaxID=4686 RepID=UPI00098E3A03|nr:uncharacterized protein LOC109840438 [Asparagus officinalis]XP_020264677.1 uncharacterized protein LOC109840438 [Asparagus officinalis]
MTITSFLSSAISSISLCEEGIQLNTNWEDVTCPICLDFPHNGVLLQCSSYHKGCRPFMCDTDHTHSNCLNRFKSAYRMSTAPKDPSTSDWSSSEAFQVIPSSPGNHPSCPLCRGEVTGWAVIVEARTYLDSKKRCCEEKSCSYVGNFMELKEHTKLKHPHSRPSEIDPARKLDWENFQQSSEIVDVLSTIHAEVPHGVVLGDYVIEYGSEGTGADDYEDFPQRQGRWWNSCILYKVFGSFRTSRNRRRLRGNSTRRGRRRSSSDGSSLDEGSPSSVDVSEYRFDETDEDFVGMGGDGGATSSGAVVRHSWRQRSRFYDT